MGLAAAGGAVLLGNTPVQAFGQSPLLARLRALETDRVLVLLQLNGGNDGLNTVIPIENDIYYNRRPTLAIAKSEALPLTSELGLHPSFDALTPLYGDGRMSILQNVGYPDPVLSHFRGTDIWLSSSSSEEVVSTGWAGRYLDMEFPEFSEEPTEFPLAVQMGGLTSRLFQGPTVNMGMSLASPELFDRIAEEGVLYSLDGLPDTTYGSEMSFVRTIANASFTYAGAIQAAAANGTNRVEYPDNNPLSANLSIVAQLIKGGLGARIYHVSLGGFDTHAAQAGQHQLLLRYLAEAVRAFHDDLSVDGLDEDVLIMTFSEFGRRVGENGSDGTDHGTAAPLFLFGGGIEGGLYGSAPDLVNLDPTGNLVFDIDFRAVYATVLQDWFGLTADEVTAVLGSTHASLGFVSDPAMPTSTDAPRIPETFVLNQNYPNPFNPVTTISYTLAQPSPVRLRIFDAQGRLVQTLYDGNQGAGNHAIPFDASHLASGTYFYRLETGASAKSRSMTLIR